MQPLNKSRIFACASDGAIQLLLGPASSLFVVQMNVRCSTRATSDGCEYARWQPGNVVGLSCLSSPVFSSDCLRRGGGGVPPAPQSGAPGGGGGVRGRAT